MMILTDGVSRFKMDLVSGDGDPYVSVSIDSRGYSGKSKMHLLADDFERFCKDLSELQRTLKGLAVLKSISPNELFIVIKPQGELGHISITGKCGNHIYTSYGCNWHSIDFGFEVEPQQLDAAVKVEWVAKYGS